MNIEAVTSKEENSILRDLCALVLPFRGSTLTVGWVVVCIFILIICYAQSENYYNVLVVGYCSLFECFQIIIK